jgi:hypothetical protein
MGRSIVIIKIKPRFFKSFLAGSIAATMSNSKVFADGNLIHYEPGTAPKYDHRICELHAFPGWYKPRADLKSYRGESRLLLLVADGLAILNPEGQGEASRHRIELDDLSLDDATNLWGPAHSGGDGILTFDLIAEWESNFETNVCETNVYHVDMKFSDKVLNSYRVRGIAITRPQWINVVNTNRKHEK